MLSLRIVFLSLALCLLPGLARASDPPVSFDSGLSPGSTVAIADFSGTDKELSGFLADTLLTDLAQSGQIHLVERTEVHQALTDLALPSTSLFTPPEVRRLGESVGADRIVVGSYLVHENQITINARLLDVQTGRPIPGAAANVTGSRRDILTLTHRLARLFHKQVTGSDLGLDTDQPPAADPTPAHAVLPAPELSSAPPAPVVTRSDPISSLQRSGLIPARARPNDPVTERELALLVTRITRRIAPLIAHPITISVPTEPVSRLRVLTALVKLSVSSDVIESYRTTSLEEMPPDAPQTPMWGLPYIAAAIAQGWWSARQPLHAREEATWAFVASLLSHTVPIGEEPALLPATTTEVPPAPVYTGPYTGLVVDARNFRVERAMGPRILDENGNALYPDPKHVPDPDYLQDHGMASYSTDLQNAPRAGSHPLIVNAIDVSGPGHDDVVVSNADAEQIRIANRRWQFFSRWNVTILVPPQH